jgi:hypothetical protein
MRAMTWYDHTTESIWSQPWGRAISGVRKGVELSLLPSQLTTWENWKRDHPETLAMTTDADRVVIFPERFSPDFVIGLVLGVEAKAYPFYTVLEEGVINDFLGEFPVVLWADGQDFRAYLRQIGDQTLTFRLEGERLVDVQTGSVWDVERGLALEGYHKGEALQSVPSLSSYDWAWLDFYPESEIYE